MNERTHLDLFSGIGGFALAARANGVRTVQFCEIDPRCREFLAKAWPGVPIHDDVRTLCLADTEQDGSERVTMGVAGTVGETEHGKESQESQLGGSPVFTADSGMADAMPAGGHNTKKETSPKSNRYRTNRRLHQRGVAGQNAWLLTAGVPCQPASRAGKQRGKEDDRWLWDEALRVLAAVRPTWAIFENPSGIKDVALGGILSSLEACGYDFPRDVQGRPCVFHIGACAINSPHRRMRYWIVCRRVSLADSSSTEREVGGGTPGVARTENARVERQATVQGYETQRWQDFVWLPCADGKVRRAPDDSFSLVDGLHRSVLGALGNSIVPQVAAQIIAAMIESEL